MAPNENVTPLKGRNVLGEALAPCCQEPRTGFYREGFCRVAPPVILESCSEAALESVELRDLR